MKIKINWIELLIFSAMIISLNISLAPSKTAMDLISRALFSGCAGYFLGKYGKPIYRG